MNIKSVGLFNKIFQITGGRAKFLTFTLFLPCMTFYKNGGLM